MHPALPGPAGTPASQPQHCYPESGERLLHRVAFLLFSITKPSVVRAPVMDIYTRLPQRPAAREWVWHTKPATLQNLHTCKKKKASTPPGNSAATHTNIALVTWERGGHGAFLAHSNVSSYRRAINKPGVRAGGGALHPPAQGKGPALSAPEGPTTSQGSAGLLPELLRGSREAPGHREAQQHPGAAPVHEGLIQDHICVGAAVPLPEPCTRSPPPPRRAGLTLHLPATLLAGAGASQYLVGASLQAQSMPGPPRRRRTSDGGAAAVPACPAVVPPAPARCLQLPPVRTAWGTSSTTSSHQLLGRPPLPNSM